MKLYFKLISVLLLATVAFAEQPIPPEQVKISTPRYKPIFGEFEPELGSYRYSVSWQGIPAADVEVSVERDGDYYKIGAFAKTYSAIDLFYKLRYKAEGVISAENLHPVKTSIDYRENRRVKLVNIDFLEGGDIHATREHVGKSKEEFRFNPDNFTLDPFSAAFLARSLDWQKGVSKYFDTFNGKSRYLITLTAEDQKQMWVNGELKDVWVIVPKIKNFSSPGQVKKLREAKIYVTADSKREILQIVSEVFIGSVKTRLRTFTPVNEPNRVAKVIFGERKNNQL